MKDIIEGLIRQLLPMVLTESVILNIRAKVHGKLKDLADSTSTGVDDALVDVILSEAVVAMLESAVIAQLEKLALSTDTTIDDMLVKLVKDAVK